MIFNELCDQTRCEITCMKSHHQVISGGLSVLQTLKLKRSMLTKSSFILLFKELAQLQHDCLNKKLEEIKGINLYL